MKKLGIVIVAVVAFFLGVAALVSAAMPYGTEYTFGGIGPSYSGYGPGPHVRSVIIHADSQTSMMFKVNGVTYPCRYRSSTNLYNCITPLLAPTYPMYIETGTGSYWWVDVTEYYTRWIAVLPSLIRDGTSAPHSTPGRTSTPLPTDQLPFAVSTRQPNSDTGSSVVTLTQEAP